MANRLHFFPSKYRRRPITGFLPLETWGIDESDTLNSTIISTQLIGSDKSTHFLMSVMITIERNSKASWKEPSHAYYQLSIFLYDNWHVYTKPIGGGPHASPKTKP